MLQEIPGVDWTLAAVIIAELGVDMSVFGNVSQLPSWAGLCPGNNESAGQRKSSRIPKGNVYLKTALVEAANAATRAKGTYLRDKLYRLKARRGYKRAAVAVASDPKPSSSARAFRIYGDIGTKSSVSGVICSSIPPLKFIFRAG